MALNLTRFDDDRIDAAYVEHALDHHAADSAVRLNKLWEYFRNTLSPASGPAAASLNTHSRPYFQAQEAGLPARITGVLRDGFRDHPTPNIERKEVVVENDIAWRVNTMVDFLFGPGIRLRSLAGEAGTAAVIEGVLAEMLDANGGPGLLMDLALLGSVYGFVDIALRTPADGEAVPPPRHISTAAPLPAVPTPGAAHRPAHSYCAAVSAARRLTLEPVEAPRILPILDEDDYRTVRLWAQRYFKHPARLADARRPGLMGLLGRSRDVPEAVEVIEIIGPRWWQRYEDRRLAAEGPNPLGRLNVAHIQNVALPGGYEGLSDVEPLIALQDELNTRLSDRAHRVTYQSFKMYLGKGIEDFLERPVGPGQMWATHNPDACIEEFGSDSASPSEDAHIEQVRQALDKVSGVTPLAAGLVRGAVGNLTSGTALRVLLSGLLARTARKRLTYGAGLARLAGLALDWLDLTGVLRTAPADRRVEVVWNDPIPADEDQRLRNAQAKAALGVPARTILAELGYPEQAS